MAETDVLELAERLGKAIADSPQARSLREAREAFATDADAKPLQQQLQQQVQRVEQLEAEGKPVEVEDKHRLRDLQDRLMANPAFRALTDAQVEYVDLMRRVNQALGKHTLDVQNPAG